MREPCAQITDQHAREIDQLLAHAARGHQYAGENEERQREQRIGVELREGLLREQRQHDAGLRRDADEADESNAQQDRDADQHHAEQQAKHQPDHHDNFSLKRIFLMTTKKRYAPPATIA